MAHTPPRTPAGPDESASFGIFGAALPHPPSDTVEELREQLRQLTLTVSS